VRALRARALELLKESTTNFLGSRCLQPDQPHLRQPGPKHKGGHTRPGVQLQLLGVKNPHDFEAHSTPPSAAGPTPSWSYRIRCSIPSISESRTWP
jgi:hypothetical protein